MRDTVKLITVLLAILLFSNCEKPNEEPAGDAFDRVAMLEHWVNGLIIPGYERYEMSLVDLKSSFEAFKINPTLPSLNDLRSRYVGALTQWQAVSMFEIGKAEELGLRSYTNIFPTDTTKIIAFLTGEAYNLGLPSNRDAQGFPAMDFLLYSASSDEATINSIENEGGELLEMIINRLILLTSQVKGGWDDEAKEAFISDRTSVDRMINDYIFYYERFLRAGKVGIPAGVFSTDPLAGHVEAPFSEVYSTKLLEDAITAVQDFFNDDVSLAEYLKFLGREDIANDINAHWNAAMKLIADLNLSIKKQVEEDPSKLLAIYDELQKATILLKVDMLQAMNVQVDYVDADGD